MSSVLVIEDNPANMKLVVFLLEKAGYRVLQAREAGTGIDLARAEHPDLILMDIQLPDMDGLAATQLLKADAATASIKIVALTAFAMKGDEENIRAAGCDGYIAKPIHYKNFLAQIESLLTERKEATPGTTNER